MSNSSSAQQAGCKFCRGREGLGIFPTRYAVARNGLGNAPDIKAPFDATARAGANKSGMNLPAPGTAPSSAELGTPFSMGGHYTQRLLRTGYLYVYDEARDEWTGNVVNQESYLFPFSRDEKPPKTDRANLHFSCNSGSCDDIHERARFVYVMEADQATNIWMKFSEVPWTDAVWERYDSQAYREKHMCRFDVAAWRARQQQPHVGELISANDHVADFCADHAGLYNETLDYIKQLLAKGWDAGQVRYLLDVAKGKKDTTQAKQCLQTVPPLIQQLAESLSNVNFQPGKGKRFHSAAWWFSPQPVDGMWRGAELETMRLKLAKLNHSYDFGKDRPALFAVDDPAGVATELNNLMIQQIAEITANPDFHWKMTTAHSIELLKQTVQDAAVQDLYHYRLQRRGAPTLQREIDRLEARQTEAKQRLQEHMAAGDTQKARWASNAIKNIGFELSRYQASLHALQTRSRVSDSQGKEIRANAWEDYLPYYKADELNEFLTGNDANGNKQQPSAHDKIAEAVAPLVDLLDNPYVAWLDSDLLANYFESNFDPQDAKHGEVYSHVAAQLVNESLGRTEVFDFLQKRLQQDPTDPKQWPVRAMLGNLDVLTSSIAGEASAHADSLDAMGNALLQKIQTGCNHVNARVTNLTDCMAAYTHQVSGIVIALGAQALKQNQLDQTGGWMLGLLAAFAKAYKQDVVVKRVQGTWNQAAAGKTLAKLLAAASGQHDNNALNDKAVRNAFATIDVSKGEQYSFDGLVIVAAGAAVAEKHAERKGDKLKRLLAFDDGLESNIKRWGRAKGGSAVAGSIFTSISVAISYEQWTKATPTELTNARINLGTGASSLTGQLSELSGKAVEWVAPRLGAETKAFALLGGVGKALGILGKTFGLIGGVGAGLWMVWQGVEEWNSAKSSGNRILGAIHIALGAATGISAIIVVFASGLLMLIGAIIGLLVALILGLIDWLQLDDMQTWLNRAYYFGQQDEGHWWNFESKDDYSEYTSALTQRQDFIQLFQGA